MHRQKRKWKKKHKFSIAILHQRKHALKLKSIKTYIFCKRGFKDIKIIAYKTEIKNWSIKFQVGKTKILMNLSYMVWCINKYNRLLWESFSWSSMDKSMLLILFFILLNKLQKLQIDIWVIHSNLKSFIKISFNVLWPKNWQSQYPTFTL